MKLSDFVFAFVAEQGVRDVFMLPGGGCMHLTDSLGQEKRLRFVACLHEQVATVAADAYAQYNRNLGVALVTTGPGSTNAITAVAGSWIESVPLLVISGQVKTADIKPHAEMRMLGFQEVDIVPMVKTVTKYAVTVTDPQSIRFHLEKAVHLARVGRPGPVWINIPLDVQAANIDPAKLAGFEPPQAAVAESTPNPALTEAVDKVLSWLGAAQRPVIMAGYGIKLSKAEQLFVRLAEKLGVPVLTTWKACDLLADDHPLFFGRPGVLAQRGANFVQQNSDFLLALGARLDFGQIGYASESFARGAKKIVVDIDPLEIAKFRFPVDLGVQVSAGDFLAELERRAAGFKRPDWSAWFGRCSQWKNSYPVVTDDYLAQKTFVNTYVLVEELSSQMTGEDLLVPGSSGACSDVCLQSFRVKRGQRVLNSPGIGAMGFGLPHTIGACVASGGKRTVNVNGDGGFQLNIQDLETVHRLGLPIKYFILNNGGYGSMRVTHRNYFQGRLVASDSSSGLTLPDMCRVADAYGIPNNRIHNHAELAAKVAEAFATKGPFLCEVLVDPEEITAPKVRSFLGREGKMVSKPLEDLYPFLDRQEFLGNMIVPPLPDYDITQ